MLPLENHRTFEHDVKAVDWLVDMAYLGVHLPVQGAEQVKVSLRFLQLQFSNFAEKVPLEEAHGVLDGILLPLGQEQHVLLCWHSSY